MRRLSREASKDRLLLLTAAHIVRFSHSRDEYPRVIRQWLTQAVRFVPDPVGLELIRTPHRMLEDLLRQGFAQGDCDDVATLAAALGKAVGSPARFRVIGFRAEGPYQHVYTELWHGNGWSELDTTRPFQLTAAQLEPARVLYVNA